MPRGAPTPLRREILLSLTVLFGGALVLSVVVIALVLPGLASAGEAAALLVALLVADLAIVYLFARALLNRRLLDPLESMTRDAQRIAEGEVRHRIEPGETPELAAMARSVNAMADRLIRDQEVLARNIQSLDETNRELVTARDEVVRAARLASVGTLAAGLAHEVGNPLGAVLGYLDVARRRAGTGADVVEPVEAALEEARRIDRIIRSLLHFASPRGEPEAPVRPAEVVDRVRRLLEAQGRFEGVAVSWDVPEDLPSLVVDPHHLEQVLVNLLLNALDALEEEEPGERRIIVSGRLEAWAPTDLPMRRRGDPPGTNYAHRRRLGLTDSTAGLRGRIHRAGRVVVLSVEDSGPGIPRAFLSSLFDPFFTTKPPGKGTGLGLAICARLVEEMGGEIEAGNLEGGGAVFVIRLPVGEGALSDGTAVGDEGPGAGERNEGDGGA